MKIPNFHAKCEQKSLLNTFQTINARRSKSVLDHFESGALYPTQWPVGINLPFVASSHDCYQSLFHPDFKRLVYAHLSLFITCLNRWASQKEEIRKKVAPTKGFG